MRRLPGRCAMLVDHASAVHIRRTRPLRRSRRHARSSRVSRCEQEFQAVFGGRLHTAHDRAAGSHPGQHPGRLCGFHARKGARARPGWYRRSLLAPSTPRLVDQVADLFGRQRGDMPASFQAGFALRPVHRDRMGHQANLNRPVNLHDVDLGARAEPQAVPQTSRSLVVTPGQARARVSLPASR